MNMVPYEAFACSCGARDVVLRESYQPKTCGKLYYACPKSKPQQNYYGCEFFLWKEERVALLIRSPGGSSTPSFSPGTSSTPMFSPTPSTPLIYYRGSSSNTKCSNCKHLLRRIKFLQATLEMHMHPEQHTLNLTSLLHDLNNDMKKLVAFVVKRFNLDPNIQFNLSFNLPAIEMDITYDEDVKFFIDYATNYLYDKIPHLYVRPTKVEAKDNTRGIGYSSEGDAAKKVNVHAGPWLSAILYLHGQGVIASGCLGDVDKYYKNGKLELVVGVIKSCTPNSDMTVTLKDSTDTVGEVVVAFALAEYISKLSAKSIAGHGSFSVALSADEHQDFALRVKRLIGDMREACEDRAALIRELRSVAGETVPAKTCVFLEDTMNKQGRWEWQLIDLEKEAREMAFEIESFLLKLMNEESSHTHVFIGDDGQRG
uniref:GRF-type domain-containing protein n=1 Tax=Tanacetum cinerariifolium TaxID=118510 RepID=A0A6L2MN72_TANCI|nr:hypothetical protein [Tanacetum cinerariifolium]